MARTPVQLIALRTLLGCFESVVTPALIMLTSAWYQKDEATPRFGFWFCGLGAGQIVGGLVSYAAQEAHAPDTKLAAWRIMFLCIGLVNILVAVLVWFFLPSTPDDARWLSSEEREIVAHRLIIDHAGIGIKKLRLRSIWETFGDVQTWLLCLLTIFNVSASGVIATYSAVLIKNFGYTGPQAALLNMPSGLVSIVGVMGGTLVVKLGYQRWVAIICASLVMLTGACLMCFLPSTVHAGLLAGIYLVNGVSVSFPHSPQPSLTSIDSRASSYTPFSFL
jgi:predicted MFS family arabinose efflux permease